MIVAIVPLAFVAFVMFVAAGGATVYWNERAVGTA